VLGAGATAFPAALRTFLPFMMEISKRKVGDFRRHFLRIWCVPPPISDPHGKADLSEERVHPRQTVRRKILLLRKFSPKRIPSCLRILLPHHPFYRRPIHGKRRPRWKLN